MSSILAIIHYQNIPEVNLHIMRLLEQWIGFMLAPIAVYMQKVHMHGH